MGKISKMWDLNVRWKPHPVFSVFSCKVRIIRGSNELKQLFLLNVIYVSLKNRGMIEFHAVKMMGLMGKIGLGGTFNTCII